MFCTSCGTGLPADAKACTQCGKAMDAAPSPAASVGTASAMAKLKGKGGLKNFLNFETMITPSIMKLYYIIGTVLIIFTTLVGSGVAFFAPIIAMSNVGGFFLGVLAWLITLISGVVSLVVFRIFCEVLILFFQMFGKLKDIKDNTDK